MFNDMIRSLIRFWVNHINPRIASLIAAIGVLGLATCLLILFIVARLSDEVLEKEAFSFDKSILLSIHSLANPYLDRVMLTITRLGNPSMMVIVLVVSLTVLWWRRYYQKAIIMAISALGAFILNTGLKLFFSKIRPELWTRLIKETSFSFPSGHALGSMVVYGFIAYLLATYYPKSAWLIYTLVTILIAAIGFSRLYLGVHWPTDIIAGYGVGFLWLMSCITMLRLREIKRRSRIS